MKRSLMLMIAAIVSGVPLAAIACGACVEDRVAATYDHAIISSAIARHQQVVFVAVDEPMGSGKIGARLIAAAPRVRGVKADSLRTSIAPPAFSFVLDPGLAPEAAVAGFRKAVGGSSARLTLVRIMRDGTLIEPK